MKVFGIALPKVVGAVLSMILGVGVVTKGTIALVPQARVGLQGAVPFVSSIPAIDPAAHLTYRVGGPSMEPTYTSGEYLTLLPLTSGNPQPCNVVALHYALNVIYLKRLVAVGPATVTWTVDSIAVNGAPACPAYLHQGNGGSGAPLSKTNVPAGNYFVVGDYLPNSADSRYVGPIAGGSIVAYLPGGLAGVAGPHHVRFISYQRRGRRRLRLAGWISFLRQSSIVAAAT